MYLSCFDKINQWKVPFIEMKLLQCLQDYSHFEQNLVDNNIFFYSSDSCVSYLIDIYFVFLFFLFSVKTLFEYLKVEFPNPNLKTRLLYITL